MVKISQQISFYPLWVNSFGLVAFWNSLTRQKCNSQMEYDMGTKCCEQKKGENNLFVLFIEVA